MGTGGSSSLNKLPEDGFEQVDDETNQVQATSKYMGKTLPAVRAIALAQQADQEATTMMVQSSNVRHSFFSTALVAVALLAAGCASGPDIRADYDHTADFGKFRTYGFVAQAGTDTAEFRSLATQTLQAAASREMEARGYTRSDNPDLTINFKGKLEEKTDIESTPAPYYGPGWGYGGWYGAPWGGYGGTAVSTRRYKVGTLVMDMIDREKRQAVFQSGIEGVVTREMMENKQAAMDQAVAHIFSRFPFVAGQAAPVAPVDQKKK